MASSKDTFEPKTFAANTFACGTFRGFGVTVVLTSPKILLTGAIQRNTAGSGNIQRNIVSTGAVQRNVGLTGDRGANAL